ncbi:4-hydroxybenzoate polyprenyltransferase [Oleidesulfovibrio alaskensis G20]|jgi:4-hydroxybenzoate polyprenyltransferase|uniref:4-hydroxybenzoate polyprenyltransferase n=1 Tax=Oleidesulfovibrio alaskensis (strain ATCC BAA-1058 / DSM 17464 / G20) TaxID=207559 RepID=Q312F5_OLEA2|nr:4-hydroxybenzoate octaprenyltransferase [Oleidesulfovibrio alaskensis]ABB38191.1 4-hydroxybenzoate polyprenyltransferase [Oleidesulfovibrio alaskensis G20]MBG0774524.1 4-hydroxybenzoate octaprenyltransferase [Oleidesulfovibrio alaskensis]MBL3581136.1 4-hydroxybenzoate octaprenyltransferase [Oleidesulfovibrio alaskensis]
MTVFGRFGAVCRMVKIEHSVFALPFAYTGAFIAAGGWPGWYTMVVLTAAMVAVRSFAMAFNRLIDLPVDRANPRTQGRPLVTGEITPAQTWAFIGVMAAVFVAACAAMNPLCLKLAPVALFMSAVYSLFKRFTWACHFFLGAVLGLAPIAGYIAVTPEFTVPVILFFWGVLFWVAGFDILYSCQDEDFDRREGLHSVPARVGVRSALIVSSFCHVNTSVFFLMAGWAAGLSWPFFAVWGLVSLILLAEHKIISAEDMSRVNMAFFTMNGVVSVVVFAGVLLGIYM